MENKNNTKANASSDEESFVVVDSDACEQSTMLSLSVVPKHDVIGIDAKMSMTQICATIEAGKLPEDMSKRAPVDIIIALDVSGSMHGEKLRLCKKSLSLLLRLLLPGDRFGLISFSDTAAIEILPKKLTQDHKQVSLDKIHALQTRGCTNISAAIGLAAQEMLGINDGHDPNTVQSIILLTDGHANQGISHTEGILDIAKGCLVNNPNKTNNTTPSPPVTIHTFGYGDNHNEDLLKKLSETTQGGTYYFVEADSDVASAFGDALGGILSVVAQNSTIHIKPSLVGAEILNVHHEFKLKKEDGSFVVSIGDFYAEESRDVLFDVKLIHPGKGDESATNLVNIPHASVELSYMDTIQKCLVNRNIPVICKIRRPIGSEVSMPNTHVVVQWLRVKTVEALKQAEQLASAGQIEAMKTVIQECKNEIKVYDTVQSHPLIKQLLVDLETVVCDLSSSQFSQRRFGQKYTTQMCQGHSLQRCAISGENSKKSSLDAYRGSRKVFYANLMRDNIKE